VRREAAYWLREGWSDLCNSAILYRAGRWNAAAFYAHQAAEKALKSLFISLLHREPPHVHHLIELYIELRQAGVELDTRLEEGLAELNKYYTVSRYPDAAAGQPYMAVTRREAERCIETARAVLEAAEGLSLRAGYEGTPEDIRNC
jgi:HEPN domain-containing protein